MWIGVAATIWLGAVLVTAGCALDRDGGAPAETSSGSGAATSSGTAGSGGDAGGTTSSGTGGTTSSGTGGTTSSGTGGSSASGTGGSTGCGSGYTCAPDPGAGSLAVVAAGSPCPNAWPTETTLYDGTDPGCTPACTCGAPSGSCTLDVHSFDWSNCSSSRDDFIGLSDGQCVDVDMPSSSQVHGYFIDLPYATETCGAAPAQTAVQLEGVNVCELDAPGPSCPGGVCVPTPPSQGPVCVVLGGQLGCPPGFPDQRQGYATADDQRSCSCSCGAPTGSSCGASSITLRDNYNCTGWSSNPLDAGYCWNVSGATSHDGFEVHVGAYSPGSCPASAQPGQVDFSDPITVCCQSSS